MDIVTGALGSVLSKLAECLKDEYNLQAGVREKITSLSRDLESMHAALRQWAEVPQNELWARDVRELSYTVEDILDEFLVRVEAGRKRKDPNMKWYQHAPNKILEVFTQAKARREISGMIDIINEKAKEVAMRRERYRLDNIVAKPATKNTVDPRLKLMYREVTQLVGIDKSRGEVMYMLQADNVSSENMVRTVSIVGAGGLGKTTLAKASYDELKSSYDCSAFVSVGQNPDFLKVFKDILYNLDKTMYMEIHNARRGVDLLISELQEFLKNKRYFIVIDDIWEPESWETIKVALDGNNGSRIIITTRKLEVAREAGEVYKLQPLSSDNSKRLFYTRLFGGEDKCPNNHSHELSDRILKKCGGVPLAIITLASLLLGKSREEWIEVCISPGFYQDKDDGHMKNTMHILSLSYYDLPSHLKTCLLYLSAFPEDSFIYKDSLIWMWIAEGFVEKEQGRGLFEVGEEYFHELINRSMIQGGDSEVIGIMDRCRVHDMVLDFIVSMSCKENFVSVDGTQSEIQARRLAHKNIELDPTQNMNLPQVRSFLVWGWCDIDKWALHPRFKLLRVLALDSCTFEEGCHNLEHIGNLLHLRYLGIRGSTIEKLPGGIGKLKFLQTLELCSTNGDLELPCSIGMLTQLVCLRAPSITAPEGVIGRLTSLEELQIEAPCDSVESRRQFVKDLGNLRELRVLDIYIDESMNRDLVQSLGNLKKMQHLKVGNSIDTINMNAWDAAVPSRNLRSLFLDYGMRFPKLPSWINSAHLPSLSHLEIHVYDVDDQSLKALGRLPELCYLKLETHTTATITEADGYFQQLRSLMLPHSMVVFVANEDSTPSFTICSKDEPVPAIGRKRKKDDCRVVTAVVVMPNLEELQFSVSVEELMENNVVSFEGLGLDYLPSIRRVKVHFWCDGAFNEDVEREEAALRDAIQVHPNRPALQTLHLGIYKKRQSDDDASATKEDEDSNYSRPVDDGYDGMQPSGTSGTRHDQMKMNTPPLVQTCDEEWILDAGAMEHCTSDQRLLPKDSRDDHIRWIGSVETERFKVPRVHYIPGAEMKNVISVSKLAEDHGLEVVFEPACCYVRDPMNGKDVGRGRQSNGVYMLHCLLIDNPQDVLPPGSGAQELGGYGHSPRKLKWPDDASWFGRTTRFGRTGYPTEDVFTVSSPHEEQRGTRTAEFYMDSGACHHVTWNGDVLKAYHETLQIKPPIESVTIGAENIQSAVTTDQLHRPLQVAGIGYIDSTGGLLDHVLFVPNSAVNLVSVNQLTVDYSVRVVFHQDEFLIEKLESKERIGHGKRVGSNYVVAVLDPCNWILDSFARVHHTTNREILYNFQETAEHLRILGNGLIRTERFNVPGVHYIPGDARNVISVAQLADDHGMVTIFEPKFCYVKEKETGEIVGEGYLRDGVYGIRVELSAT